MGIKDQVQSFICDILDGISSLCGLIAGVFAFIAILAGISGGAMAVWDFSVWLFKADWRTTNFQFSLYALGVCLAAALPAAIFGWAQERMAEVSDWLNPQVREKKLRLERSKEEEIERHRRWEQERKQEDEAERQREEDDRRQIKEANERAFQAMMERKRAKKRAKKQGE